MWDAIVIGAGPNGLVAAATLARHGWSVLVLEAQDRPGGAVWSQELTRPGFVHDVGAAFFPFGRSSPAFQSLELTQGGLEWLNADIESAHPSLDGTCPAIARNLEATLDTFGADAGAWSKLHRWQERMGERLPQFLLAPLPAMGAAFRLGLGNAFALARAGLASPVGYASRRFTTDAARRIIPQMALHVDLAPQDFGGAALGLVLTLLAMQDGFLVPRGGARALTQSLLTRFEQARGELRLGQRATKIVIGHGRPVAVHTANGDEFPVRRAVLADVTAPALYLKLIGEDHLGRWVRRRIRRFRFAWGTFKVDWALSGPVPWNCEPARRAAVVHTGDNVEDLIRFAKEVRDGQLPTNPYLVIGQQSLVDPSRAPDGNHTLWAYSRVPSAMPDGWQRHAAEFADRIEARIEGLAPGFRSLILDRHIATPEDLEAMDENLVGGDLSGGSNRFSQQLFLRPVFPYFRYRTPIRGVYLASSSAHPGAGVHGACGYNAAQMAIRDYDGK